jgi:hypothetical protein
VLLHWKNPRLDPKQGVDGYDAKLNQVLDKLKSSLVYC